MPLHVQCQDKEVFIVTLIRSPHPSPVIPDVSLQEFLFGDLANPHGLGNAADHVAIIDGTTGAALTYAQLIVRIRSAAAALHAQGVGRGDIVAIDLPNSSEFVIVFHAIGALGATVSPVPVLASPDDIRRQLSASGARFAVSTDTTREAVRAAATNGETLLDAHEIAHASADPSWLTAWAPPHTDAVLPFSSGTTGHPKGVRLSHRNLVANVLQIEDRIGVEHIDTVMGVLPFFHIYGLTVLVNLVLRRRATLIAMPRFELGGFLSLIGDHQATFAFIAPPIAVALAKHPAIDGAELSSLRELFSGAAPMDAGLASAVETRLGVTVRQGYGMTELSPVSHFVGHREQAPHSSIGTPVGGTDNLVVGLDGKPVDVPTEGLSEPGELWVRGPNVMIEYVNDPDSTATSLDADGFLHTGDLVRIDHDLNVYVVDRLKELIKYKGYQVPPAELEAVLLSHPQIADAAVVGLAEPDVGEIPVAFVVIREPDSLSAEDVMEFVASRVSPYQRVRRIEFCDAVPKSASGKILRRELRDRLG
jgi:4-coumarate--CoA ligase